MSNLETQPAERASTSLASTSLASTGPARPAAGTVEILEPRLVPLGGPRAMTVRRTLPQRQRSLIGGWCFLDHYGPDQIADTGGMRVPPHPHTQLQTVSWLFTGEIEHRDSAGHHTFVRAGELNLMTAGRGISHSEVSTPATSVLRGVQLWVALPSAARFTEPGFEHYAPSPVRGPGFTARIFLGSLLGDTSPARTHSPLLGAELAIAPGRPLTIPVNPAFEHGILVDTGTITLTTGPADTVTVAADRLAYVGLGATAIELSATGGSARVLLLGGEPLGEQIVMWWNFIGRTHQEIVSYRAAWQAEIAAVPPRDGAIDPGRDGAIDPAPFGLPPGDPHPPIPAPPLPNATLRPRP
jgi:redox-sensitive bicupin YhaK (pirin superfamily)